MKSHHVQYELINLATLKALSFITESLQSFERGVLSTSFLSAMTDHNLVELKSPNFEFNGDEDS